MKSSASGPEKAAVGLMVSVWVGFVLVKTKDCTEKSPRVVLPKFRLVGVIVSRRRSPPRPGWRRRRPR